jgi:hypothetical protein
MATALRVEVTADPAVTERPRDAVNDLDTLPGDNVANRRPTASTRAMLDGAATSRASPVLRWLVTAEPAEVARLTCGWRGDDTDPADETLLALATSRVPVATTADAVERTTAAPRPLTTADPAVTLRDGAGCLTADTDPVLVTDLDFTICRIEDTTEPALIDRAKRVSRASATALAAVTARVGWACLIPLTLTALLTE